MIQELNLPEEYLSQIIASIVDVVPVEAIYVFGSYARGEETSESDLDLYVVTRDDDESRFTRAGRVGRALLWMGMPKDILLGSANRFAERRSNVGAIEYVVTHEGVKVYG